MPDAPDLMLLATCRAEPESADDHNHVPLPAGQYRLAVIARRRARKPTLDEDWCDCHTCEHAPHYQTRAKLHALPSGDVVIAVHGFNCTEKAGLETAYNIRDSLRAWGVGICPTDETPQDGQARVIGFTWPCEHTLFPGYMADKEAVARFAAFSLANLIMDLRRAEPDRRIHLIAHSMGCFLTLKALNMLAVLHMNARPATLPLVNEVIWLAPDINADALERSTPQSPRLRAWDHPGQRLPFSKVLLAFKRPEPLRDFQTNVNQNGAHPLDGYGYAALDVIRRLSVYSSLRDEALWASPLANHATEESGSAAGSIRLGWCGPLHPGLVMVPDAAASHRQRRVTLVDCSDIVFEHGGYFFAPVAQRDIASRIATAQARAVRHEEAVASSAVEQANATLVRNTALATRARVAAHPTRPRPAVTPPPERVARASWHTGAPLSFPAVGERVPDGLQMYSLRPADPRDALATRPQPGAPVAPDDSLSALMPEFWRAPIIRGILETLVRFWCWYYRVGNRSAPTPAPNVTSPTPEPAQHPMKNRFGS